MYYNIFVIAVLKQFSILKKDVCLLIYYIFLTIKWYFIITIYPLEFIIFKLKRFELIEQSSAE